MRSGHLTAQTLALAIDGQLHSVSSSAPNGSLTPLLGSATGGSCEDEEPQPVYVDQFVAWSPDGTRIAIFNHADCQFDDRMDWYFTATEERRTYATSGADCCGYTDWSDLFWGPATSSATPSATSDPTARTSTHLPGSSTPDSSHATVTPALRRRRPASTWR